MKDKKISPETWLWAIVQNPGRNESFLGQNDTVNNIRFIPAFLDKESAYSCINAFTRDPFAPYEPQAVIFEDLMNYANKNGFLIFMLNNKGEIIKKFPEEQQ